MATFNGERAVISHYGPEDYAFAAAVKKALGIEQEQDLSQLHTFFELDEVVSRETDSTTPIHRRYYERIAATDFYGEYRRFVHEVVSGLVPGPLIVQKVPSFRAHLPGNKAVGEYHRDRDYGHQPAAITFWVPLTPAFATNALHIRFTDTAPAVPVPVSIGELLIFDGVNLQHGNELNQTAQTRVSFDFRVIPRAEYVETPGSAINTGIPLSLGGYYANASEL